MYAREMHAREVHAYEVHAHKVHACEVHAREVHILRRRDAQVPAAKRILNALCHCDGGSVVTQTTNFRDRPRDAPGMTNPL